MFRYMRKNPLRGGLYHVGLLLVVGSAFNWGFQKLTSIDIAGRIFTGVEIPQAGVALALCIAAIVVLWNNWVD